MWIEKTIVPIGVHSALLLRVSPNVRFASECAMHEKIKHEIKGGSEDQRKDDNHGKVVRE